MSIINCICATAVKCDLVHLSDSISGYIFRSTPPSRPNRPKSNKVGLKCPPARPYTKSFLDFNEIRYVGTGSRVMHDGMEYETIQGQGHEPPESRKFGHFQRLSPPPFIRGTGK